jgi:hypothetical protein
MLETCKSIVEVQIRIMSNRRPLWNQSLVYGTWALVAVTLLLVGVTWWMARLQNDAVRRDLRARLQLQFIDRFDGPKMVKARKELAHLFLSKAKHDEIKETVMEVFEDMSLFLGRGYLDEELLWSTSGFYAVRWWAQYKGYALEERKRQSDSTLFTDFEDLAKRFLARDAKAA